VRRVALQAQAELQVSDVVWRVTIPALARCHAGLRCGVSMKPCTTGRHLHFPPKVSHKDLCGRDYRKDLGFALPGAATVLGTQLCISA
jgi:hypothetical protein